MKKLVELVEAFTVLEDFKWVRGTTLPQFLGQFLEKVEEVRKSGGELSDQYLSLRLLRSSNLDKLHHCLDNINISELTYKEVRNLLCKIYKDTGNQLTDNNQNKRETVSNDNPQKLNVEFRGWPGEGNAYIYTTMGQDLSAKNKLPLRDKNISKNLGEKRKKVMVTNSDTATSINTLRHGLNPSNKNKTVSKCVICRSVYHWSMDCPDQSSHNIDIDPGALESLQEYTEGGGYNATVISSNVSKSVCGLPWLRSYLNSLSPQEKSQIVETSSSHVFNFRKVGPVTSMKKLVIPLIKDDARRKQINVEVEVVDRNIPLCLSRSTLKRSKARIDSNTETVVISGVRCHFNISKHGLHYLLLSSAIRPPETDSSTHTVSG